MIFYVDLMVTTKQKPTEKIQRIKRRKLKHTIKENHQYIQQERGKKKN